MNPEIGLAAIDETIVLHWLPLGDVSALLLEQPTRVAVPTTTAAIS